MQVRRAYKFRAYLTCPQEGRAARLLRDHCDLYNAALEERWEAWRMRKVTVSYGMQSAQLRDIRKTDPDGHGRHSFTAQFASILTGKAESAGRRVIPVNPAGTSITCHACGQRCERPRQDTVICPDCGPHDADVNGARNIYARAGPGSGQAAAAA